MPAHIPLILLVLGLLDGPREEVRPAPGHTAPQQECVPAAAADAGAPSAGIDADVWLPVCAAVAADDIDALGRTYHPAAVLVSPGGTVPIAQALARWKQSAAEARARGVRATVSFRFSQRQDDAATAFESGIFRYAMTDAAGATTVDYVPFEALFVREEGTWLMLMERQLEPAAQAAWDALPH